MLLNEHERYACNHFQILDIEDQEDSLESEQQMDIVRILEGNEKFSLPLNDLGFIVLRDTEELFAPTSKTGDDSEDPLQSLGGFGAILSFLQNRRYVHANKSVVHEVKTLLANWLSIHSFYAM